jgi:hypothetical protein
MTERHLPPRPPRLEDVAEWPPSEGPPEKVGAACAVSVIIVETYGVIGSGESEGC